MNKLKIQQTQQLCCVELSLGIGNITSLTECTGDLLQPPHGINNKNTEKIIPLKKSTTKLQNVAGSTWLSLFMDGLHDISSNNINNLLNAFKIPSYG